MKYLNANLPQNIRIHESSLIYGDNSIDNSCIIFENVILGYPTSSIIKECSNLAIPISEYDFKGTTIGKNAILRSGSIIYSDVEIGNDFRGGHNILIREHTNIGNNVLIGTNVIVDGNTRIGNNVSVQSNAYIPTNTTIEDNVFIGPCAVLTNDKYPIRKKYELAGPTLRRGVSIGANSTILPAIEIGEGAMVAAGALVTKDVPPWKLAIGSPAKIIELPDDLKTINSI